MSRAGCCAGWHDHTPPPPRIPAPGTKTTDAAFGRAMAAGYALAYGYNLAAGAWIRHTDEDADDYDDFER
ncbi:hypothetical protein ACPA54_07150 [Uniformispora flossi]|uniref:hypothetical protein n=1 Tax=Uniformispora flossi TaxID=3390723 RepID=UPI003C2DD8BC